MFKMYDEFILSVATEQENPIKYRSVVMESVKSSATVRARLVDVLYQDIVKRKNYNFDVIPSTMGNVTKMPSYATFLEALEALKQLTAGERKGQVRDTVQLVVDLHNKIVIRRADFEYGYKMHIDIVQLAYCTAVSALYQLMNVCIYAVSSTVTDGVTMSEAFNKACARNDYLLQSAMGMNRALDDKNWKEFMTPLKKNTKNFLGTNPESVVRESDDFVEEEYEAGIELVGTEVKSIRAGTLNLKDAWCGIKNGELLVNQMHISPYDHGNRFNVDSRRPRRLLMHKREIMRLYGKVKQDGYSLIPLSVYFKGSRVKIKVGLCKGKKLYDKRQSAAEADAKRQIDRAMKERY